MGNPSIFSTVMVTLISVSTTVSGNLDRMPKYLVDEYEIECPDYTTPALPYIHIQWNTPFRAYKTLPAGLRISKSIIPEGGIGVFSDIFIKRYTVLAEFDGEVVIKLRHISDYAWKVKRNGKKSFYIDAHDVATSNWLRWINCSRNQREENVEVWECKGNMYYVSNREIAPGEELLIYYGDGYAHDLNIDVDNYNNVGQVNSNSASSTNNCTDNNNL